MALFDFGRRNQSKIEKKCVAKFLPRIRVVRVNSDIEKLLNLQTKDAALSAIKGRLDAVPQEIESKRAEIRAVEKDCDAAREKLRAARSAGRLKKKYSSTKTSSSRSKKTTTTPQ